MLDDLVDLIEELQKRIKEHGAHIGDYEKRTRVALIDPLLCSLGWNVSDPAAVEVETKTANGWADYALLGANRLPVMFIEAKKLADKDAPITQTVGYAVSENISNNTNVRYCASTNGDRWEVYDLSQQRSVVKASIAGDDPAKCAFQLLGLWRRSLLEKGRFEQAIEPLLELGSPKDSEPVDEELPVPPPVQPPFVGPEWTPLNQVPDPKLKPSPITIRLPDGERTLTAWRGVLAQTALWLARKGTLTKENCTIMTGGKRAIFSLNGVHPGGIPFKSPVSLEGTGIVMEGNLSARSAVRQAKRVLEHFHQDPSQVFLRLR